MSRIKESKVSFMREDQIKQLINLLDDIVLKSGESPEWVLKDIILMIISAHSFSSAQRQLIVDDICTTYNQKHYKIFNQNEKEEIPF